MLKYRLFVLYLYRCLQVLDKFCLTGGKDDGAAKLELHLRTLVFQRWVAIGNKLMKNADPVQFVANATGGLGVSAGPPGMPDKLEQIPAWYDREYKAKILEPSKELQRMDAPALNPGRTWRTGMAEEVFGPHFYDNAPYYPENVPGREGTQAKNQRGRKHQRTHGSLESCTRAPLTPSRRLSRRLLRSPACLRATRRSTTCQ